MYMSQSHLSQSLLLKDSWSLRVSFYAFIFNSRIPISTLIFSLFSYHNFYTQNVGDDEMIVSISKPPEFLNKIWVNWTVEALKVVSPTLLMKFFSEVYAISLHVVKSTRDSHSTSSFSKGVARFI